MPNLKKYMAKNKIKPAPEWEKAEVEGHGQTSSDAFETADTENDPLDEGDETELDEPETKKAMTNLEKYEKLKQKK